MTVKTEIKTANMLYIALPPSHCDHTPLRLTVGSTGVGTILVFGPVVSRGNPPRLKVINGMYVQVDCVFHSTTSLTSKLLRKEERERGGGGRGEREREEGRGGRGERGTN